MNILENSTGVDYLKNVVVDESAIIKVEVDDSKVDLTKAGDYTINYKETVNTTMKKFKNKEESVKINRTVHVVNQEIAQGIADEDKVVYTTDMAVMPKSTGEAVTVEEPTVNIKNAVTAEQNNSENKKNLVRDTSNNGNSSSSSSSNNNKPSNNDSKPSGSDSKPSNNDSKPSGGTSSGNTDSDSKPSGSDSKPSGSSTGITTPSQPSHTHNWTPVYKTVTVKDAWDETVVVIAAWDEKIYESRVVCGEQFMSVSAWNLHGLEDVCPYSYTVKKVQTGTKYHDAVAKTVHHDAVTKQEVDYYTCSCGARK